MGNLSSLLKLLQAQPSKFIGGGFFLKAVSFSLNFLLAELIGIDIRWAYFLVMVVDFCLGFAINRFFVFNKTFNKSHRRVFIEFIFVGASFRFLDWLIYVWLIENYQLYTMVAQLISAVVILSTKFVLYKKIFK